MCHYPRVYALSVILLIENNIIIFIVMCFVIGRVSGGLMSISTKGLGEIGPYFMDLMYR